MRFGLSLISLGILLLALGVITFPFPIAVKVNENYTVPAWISSAKVTVVEGNFTIFTYKQAMMVGAGYSNVFHEQFGIIGNGTAIITIQGIRLFYNNIYEFVSLFLIIIGGEIEIITILNNRKKFRLPSEK